MDWKIWYGNGTTFSSEKGMSNDAPTTNVQAVVVRDTDTSGSNVGHFVLQRRDYYWHESDEWYCGDIFGLFDFLMRSGLVKFGRSIPNSEYRQIMKRIENDSDFPRKSGYRPDETRT